MSQQQRYVANFRKASIRRWQDRSFRALSANPSAKLLLLFLEQGPHTTSLAGLFSAGRAALAESIGWSVEEFSAAFSELERVRYAKADWQAPLVWLQNYTMQDFNAPSSPSNFRSWCLNFEALPDCALKDEAAGAIGRFLRAMAESPDTRPTLRDWATEWVGRYTMVDTLPCSIPTTETETETKTKTQTL